MYCHKCGKEFDDDVRFCPYCGTKIKYYSDKKTEKENNSENSLNNTERKPSGYSLPSISENAKRVIAFIVVIAITAVLLAGIYAPKPNLLEEIGNSALNIWHSNFFGNNNTENDSDFVSDEEDEDIDDSDDDLDYEPETEADEEGRIHNEKVFEAYYSYLSDWYDYFTDNDATAEVAFYDINNDGTDEMIVSYGGSLADWTNEVYCLNGYNVEEAGEIGSQQSFYEAEDGNGLYLVRGIQGMEIITQLTMDDEDNIQTEEISNTHIDADEDYYSNDYPIEFIDIDDYL